MPVLVGHPAELADHDARRQFRALALPRERDATRPEPDARFLGVNQKHGPAGSRCGRVLPSRELASRVRGPREAKAEVPERLLEPLQLPSSA